MSPRWKIIVYEIKHYLYVKKWKYRKSESFPPCCPSLPWRFERQVQEKMKSREKQQILFILTALQQSLFWKSFSCYSFLHSIGSVQSCQTFSAGLFAFMFWGQQCSKMRVACACYTAIIAFCASIPSMVNIVQL